jgi:hypothetical protein
MSFGGQDILIEAPPDVPAADVILRCLRLLWPDAYFQDADQEDYHPVDSPRVLIQGGRSREFFVFINRGAAESWNRDGATPENSNSMVHFLVEDRPRSRRSPRHVTLVCDEVSEAIERLAADLKKSFWGSRPPMPRNRAA